MGEVQGTLFQPEFNRSLRVEARPERLTADAGTVLLREIMDRTRLSALLVEHLADARDGRRTRHPLVELLRTQILLDAQGWCDQTDVDLLRADPAFRLAVSTRRAQSPLRPSEGRAPEGLCSQPTLSRLLEALSGQENRSALGEVLLEWAAPRIRNEAGDTVIVDLDSVPLEVHGNQPGSAYNGHYRTRCYHPLLVRSETGEFLGGRLRPGNAHTADGGLAFILPILRRVREWAPRVWLRVDAGFPEPGLLTALEEEDMRYVARLRSNATLERLATPHLRRPPGRPPAEGRVWLHELRYAAGSWHQQRRVVLVMLEQPGEQGHLFLDHFFLLTNASIEEMDAQALLASYRQRGTAEKDFGDWKEALDLSLSSTPRPKSHYQGRSVESEYRQPDSFAVNEARLLLSLIAANLLRRGTQLLERRTQQAYSRKRFRQLVLRSAGRVLLKSRGVTLVIESSRAPLWQFLWSELDRLYPARGSPAASTLPAAA